jgi:sucrose-6-phosphate hydrolase SacC (GH32 family)
MRWRRLGKIFDPASVNLVEGQCGFAQSPQALVCERHVRIYFSTRTRDPSGQYLSHVAFVDFDRSLSRLIGHSHGMVTPLGKLGAFDEHGIFPMSVIRVGEQIFGYTTGWTRRRSVPVDSAIGLVVSDDGGASFRKVCDGPILGPSLTQPCLVGDAFVAHFRGHYHMWYIYGTRWLTGQPQDSPERVYKIVHASSANAIEWTISRGTPPIADRLGTDECQALPTAVELGGRFHMWFCYREATDFRTNRLRGYRIGHAVSDDLRTWTRQDEDGGLEPGGHGWDCDMVCYPNVFHLDGQLYMLYNGNEFGRAGFGLAVLEH